MERKITCLIFAGLFFIFTSQSFAQNKPPPREIIVNIAVNQIYVQNNPAWREEIEKVIQKTNKVYGELPRPISFKIKETKIWQSSGDLLDALIAQLENLNFGEKAQITVGFIGQETNCLEEDGSASGCVGLAIFAGNFVLVSKNNFSPDEQASILIHEIGHIFGAKHVKTPNSYMLEETEPSPKENLDEESIKTIMENRDREF